MDTDQTPLVLPDPLKKLKKRRKKKKRPPHKSKMITGYIIYASEIRKDIIKKHPDRDFGFISKVVGLEWKNLPQVTKAAYEKRAQEQNVKSKAIAAEALELKRLADAAAELSAKDASSSSLSASGHLPPPGRLVNGDSHPHDTNNNSNGTHDSHLINDAANNHHINFSSQVMQSNMQQQYLVQQPSTVRSHANNGMQQHVSQNQPFQHHIVQQHIVQPNVTTVQYCSGNNVTSNHNNTNNTYSPNQSLSYQQITQCDSSNSPFSQVQYQKNNIVYRKPTTVRLKPRESTTQTEPQVWVQPEPKKLLKFSKKFLDYLDDLRKAREAQSTTL